VQDFSNTILSYNIVLSFDFLLVLNEVMPDFFSGNKKADIKSALLDSLQ